MFRCERCGTGFNPTVAAFMDGCPRCKARGVAAKVSFKLFDSPAQQVAGAEPQRGKDRSGER